DETDQHRQERDGDADEERDAGARRDAPGEVAAEVVGAEQVPGRERRLERHEQVLVEIEVLQTRRQDDDRPGEPDDDEAERDESSEERELVRHEQREGVAPPPRRCGELERLCGGDAHLWAEAPRTRGSAQRWPRSARKLKKITATVRSSASVCA